MAGSDFNITAQIHLQAPNAKGFSRDLQKQLKNPKLSVNLQGGPKTVQGLNKVAKATKEVEKQSQRAGKSADYMGRQLGSAFKQIVKYDIARRIFSLFADAIESGVKDAIAFERAMVKVAQVSGASAREMKNLEQTISRVAKQFGVSSQTLARTTLILKQTGLSVKETKVAMEALAKTELAPTFDNITDTAEMAIAAMRQFGIEASKLETLLGRINVVAANFAVESSDIGVAIRRAGGSFKAAGGQIEELIALFTSVRATTRETAETIATGFRTIFTRLQRPTTIKFLRQFGIELQDLQGKFIGPYKAVEKLHGALKNLDPKDVRYSMIVEQLGGFRQVSKVIPLIQQFGTAQAALNAQQAESGSLASDAAKAQLSLAVQIQKLTENVKELFREIVGSDTFQMMAKGALAFANAIVKIGKALAPVIPLITAMMGMKAAGWAMGSMKMMGGRGLAAATGSMAGGGGGAGMGGFNKGGRVRRFSQGGWVPGSGNGDTVPAMLEPGEFVLRKSAAQAFGPSLSGINKYGKGTGSKGVDPDGMTASATPVLSKALFQSVYDGDSYRIHGIPSQKKWNTTTRLAGGVDAYEVKAMTSISGKLWAQREKELGLLGKDLAEEHAKFKKNENIIGKFSGVDPNDKEKYGRPMMKDDALAADLVKQGLGERGKASGSLQERVMAYAKGRTRSGINSGKAGSQYKQWIGEERKRLELAKAAGQSVQNRATGGMIDSVPALLTPGEFVVNKKSAQRFGYGGLSRMNKFARGGSVRRYAGGTGGSGVLPTGMGGGMGDMAGMMMMQMGGFGETIGKTGKSAKNAMAGLTDVGMSATMAYTKFQFMTQSMGAFAGMLGLGGDAMDAFIGRVGQVGGALATAFDVLSNPVAQKGISKAADYAMMAMMMFGGKLKGLGKLIPGGAAAGKMAQAGGRGIASGTSKLGTKVGSKVGLFGLGRKEFASKPTMGSIYSGKQRKLLNIKGQRGLRDAKNYGREAGKQISIGKTAKTTRDTALATRQTALATQKTSQAAQQKAAQKLASAQTAGHKMQLELNKTNAQMAKAQRRYIEGGLDANKGKWMKDGGTRGQSSLKRSGLANQAYAKAEMKEIAARRANLKSGLASNTQRVSTYSQRSSAAGKAAFEAGETAAKSGKTAIAASKTMKESGKAAGAAIKAGKASKVAGKASLLAAKNGLKLAKIFTGVGIAALVVEETIGYFGRAMQEAAMTTIAESGGKFAEGEEAALTSKAATGGAISGAATGAGIGLAIGLMTGPLAPIMAPLLTGVGALVGGIWGWYAAAEGAREAIEKAKFDKATKDMAESMDKFSKGLVTASMAVNDIEAMQQQEQGMKDWGVSIAEVTKNRVTQRTNAATILETQGQKAKSVDDFKADDSVNRLKKMGLITQDQIDSQIELIEANVKARNEMKLYVEAQQESNKALRKLVGYVGAIGEMSNRLSTFGSNIENIAAPGSGEIGKTQDLFNQAGTSKKATADFETAIDKMSNIAGGNSLEPFAQKAKDASFVQANIEDILLRSSASAGLDTENTKSIILDDLKATAADEGRALGPYMQKRMEKIIGSLDEETLADLETNAPEIAKKIEEDQEKFLEVFKNAAALLDTYTGELNAAYAAKLKLEQEYISRQQSLMQARFDSEEKFRQNLSASAFAGTSNADVQSNFRGKQRMLIEGSGGIGGLSASRQASLAAKGGVGSVGAVGETFNEISKELRASQKDLINAGLDPNALGDSNTQALADSQQQLIERNQELQGEYDATKKVLENYANSQERLTALNRELEEAQGKRKTLKDLSVQARYGTADEKDQAARLINAITIASQQGIDAVAPELQRQVVGYMPQLMGAQGESIVNAGINNAYGGGQGIAGITEVSAEEKRLATEIKAIEDAGIVAGEHLAEEVGDRIGAMADSIKELNKTFIIDLRTIFLEEREKQAEGDKRLAESELTGATKDADLLAEFGIKGTGSVAGGDLAYDEKDQMSLNNLKNLQGLNDNMIRQEKERAAYGDVNLKDVYKNLGGSANFGEGMADNTTDSTGTMFGVAYNSEEGNRQSDLLNDMLGTTREDWLSGMGGDTEGDNYDVASFNDEELDSMNKIIRKMAAKFQEAGGDINAFETAASDLMAKEGAEGQDVYGPLIRMMAEQQEKTKESIGDVFTELEGKVSSEVLDKIRNLSGDERKEYIDRAIKAGEVGGGNLNTFTDSAKKAHDDAEAAKAELQDINKASTDLTTEATNRGSIYTHDIHCERILLNILSVLEGKGRTVDLKEATAYGETGASSAGDLAKASQLGSKMADKSGAFMSKYGGQSLAELQGMATDGGLNKNFMTDLDASSLSDEAKQSIKDTVEGADGWMAGNSGVGSYGAGGEGGTLSESMGPDFMKEAVAQAASAITEGSAAANIAAQMMAVIDTSALTDVTDIFSKNIEEFGTAMGSPLNIEVGGSIEVNVNMSGAEFLKDAGGALAEMAGSAASKAINNFIGQMNKSSNIKPNPNGWHESGQPKPLTGNQGGG